MAGLAPRPALIGIEETLLKEDDAGSAGVFVRLDRNVLFTYRSDLSPWACMADMSLVNRPVCCHAP